MQYLTETKDFINISNNIMGVNKCPQSSIDVVAIYQKYMYVVTGSLRTRFIFTQT